jgi:hypothetical protein
VEEETSQREEEEDVMEEEGTQPTISTPAEPATEMSQRPGIRLGEE